MIISRLLGCAIVTGLAATLPAQDRPRPVAVAAGDDGFKLLFNGKNLDGWVNVNCHPDTFFVKGGEIITTGKPTGFLRTEKQYENFILEMDWMHVNTKDVGNSGLFVWGDPLPAVGTGYTRGIEVQVLVNLEYRDKKTNAVTATSHGDLFSIWGAKCLPDRPHPLGWERCLPSENRAKGGGEWNHYKVTANNGVIKLEVNGKEVSGVSQCNPRKGYLALESEDAECRFKNIRIKELPSTNPKPEEIANVAEGHVSLFNGVNLKGWSELTATGRPPEMLDWTVVDGKIRCGSDNWLWSDKHFTRYEMFFDWKLPDKEDTNYIVWVPGGSLLQMTPRGMGAFTYGDSDEPRGPWLENKSEFCNVQHAKPGSWARVGVKFDGAALTTYLNGQLAMICKAKKDPTPGPFRFTDREGFEIMNVFVRDLKEAK